GLGHPITLQCKSNLARSYQLQRKRAEAETLYRDVLDVQTTTLGPGHPETLQARNNLAVLYSSMKKTDRSIPLFEEVLGRRKANLGPGHPETLQTQVHLGATYCNARRFADGIRLLEGAYRKSRQYPQLAKVGNALLKGYLQAGKNKEAVALVKEQVGAARE